MDGDEARDVAFKVAMGMYLGEPCRICGRLIEVEDLKGLKFAGYSEKYPARAAHRRCWEGMLDILHDIPYGQADQVVMSWLLAERT